MREFYGYFAAAYGTCWFVLMLVATISMSHIDAGPIGYFAFPLAGLVDAGLRMSRRRDRRDQADEIEWLRGRVVQREAQLGARKGP